MSQAEFADTFANGLPDDQVAGAYERYVVPTPGRVFWQAAFAPFNSVTAVDWSRADRAPLLIVAGGQDRTVTASMNASNHRKYRSGKVDFELYPDRSHFTIGEPGWEEVADASRAWALGAT